MSKKLQVSEGMPGFDSIGARNVLEPDGKTAIATIWRHKSSKAVVLQFSKHQWEGLDGDYTMDSDNRLFDGDHIEIPYFGIFVVVCILHDPVCACIFVDIVTVHCAELEEAQTPHVEDTGIVVLIEFLHSHCPLSHRCSRWNCLWMGAHKNDWWCECHNALEQK